MIEETKKGSFTILLSAVDIDDASGYSIEGDEIQITVGKETVTRFERDVERFGIEVADALAHTLLRLIKDP